MRIRVETNKDIYVKNPTECPFNSECQCKLYTEGGQANECPLGTYGDYKFPPLCPLLKDNYIIELSSDANV